MKSGLLDSAQGNLSTDLLDQQLSVAMAEQRRPVRCHQQAAGAQHGRRRRRGRRNCRAFHPEPEPQCLAQCGQRRLERQPQPGCAIDQCLCTGSQGARQLRDGAHRRGAACGQRERHPGSLHDQAGHETGWGKTDPQQGRQQLVQSVRHQAGGSWTGKVAEVTTTEYINGAPKKVTAKFRAYDSYEESFRDYARLIGSNPRYEKAMAQTGSAQAYASELQKAGYATDPAYAQKLSRAIQSVAQVTVASAGNSSANVASRLGASARAAQINKITENQS
jgi:flagellar protein FlgJ